MTANRYRVLSGVTAVFWNSGSEVMVAQLCGSTETTELLFYFKNDRFCVCELSFNKPIKIILSNHKY